MTAAKEKMSGKKSKIDMDSTPKIFLQALPCSPPSPFVIGQLEAMDDAHKIIFNTEFQRGEVWDITRKQKLIDSILRGYSINTIFLRQLNDGRYECLDGQQRLKTVLKDFLKNKFPISPKITPEFKERLYFKDLSDFLKNKIKSYPLYAVIIYTTNDEETCTVFLRLQEGLPLNSPEKLNAMLGFLRNDIVELAQHPFFSKIGMRNYRFAHRYMVAQAYLLTLKDQITDVKFRQLQEIYNAYQFTPSPEHKKKTIKTVLNLMKKEFGTDAQLIRHSADFISFYLLVRHLLDNYVTNDGELDIKNFYNQFIVRVSEVESSEGQDNAPYYDYKTYRRTSADARTSIDKRHNILVSKYLEYNQTLKPKDQTRDFNLWEKIAIYHKSHGICQICKKKTPFVQGHADHKKPHSRGGPTTIKNGQWLCKKCNLKKLDKF